jgi:hypothetical protein
MTVPFVSCLCPTFGRCPVRQWLLEEAVESFLRQDYPAGRRELVVLNDAAAQELVCEAPGVRVVNEASRYPTLGDKYNALVRLAAGELLAPWEDDDISLPHRLSLSVERLGAADYFNPLAYWFLQGSLLVHEQRTGYAHSASLFRRRAWERAGGYPSDCRQDAGMDARLRQQGRTVDGVLSAGQSVYVYRWGVSDHHVSAYGEPEQAYAEYGRRPYSAGRFVLRPHWRQEYARLTALAASRA